MAANLKKNYWHLMPLLVLSILLASCQTTGKPIAGIQQGENFRAERSVNGNNVAIEMVYSPSLPDSEIAIIAEQIPDGISIVESSAVPLPDFKTPNLMVWLFSKGSDQSLGPFAVARRIPIVISYQVQGTPSASSAFSGKWGLKNLNLEGAILTRDSGATGSDGNGGTGTGGTGTGGTGTGNAGTGNTGSGGSSTNQSALNDGWKALYDYNHDGKVSTNDILAAFELWPDGAMNGRTVNTPFILAMFEIWEP